jgi:hypothetical protein
MISKFFAWCPSELLIRRNCYVSGPPNLFRAASEGAKKRRYHQSLFNGEPAQVRTDIVIVFAPTDETKISR